MANNYRVSNSPKEEIFPKGIRKKGNQELKIEWSDGHNSVYPFRWIRQNCQCALCVDEWSGKQVLEREQIAKDIEGLKVNVVGQYAISIHFSDGHSTGIYAFKHLRKICTCDACMSHGEKSKEDGNSEYLNKQELRKREE